MILLGGPLKIFQLRELLALMSSLKVLDVYFLLILDSEDQFLNWKPTSVTTVDRGRSDVFEILPINSYGKRKAKYREFERFESQYGTVPIYKYCDNENEDDEDEGISLDIQSWVARLRVDENTF
ncbi:hypothetical protein M9H77_21414 [Catharanthus roseus]|uniref:Uncharacterized protein n=1 Tax=Catharanthus roseus TaxID=4058 RepID=A0ACC0ANA7_CATRO|nr:hypothetical protein M9H77_21414 [Catharanthus roseus]